MSPRGIALGLVAVLGAQDVESGGRSTYALFSAVLPDGWRAMTPDEMFAIESQLPFVMREVQPEYHFAIGDVERWLERGFDGRALVVDVQSGEIPADPESLERIRTHWSGSESGGPRRDVVAAELTELGSDRHPAIRCRISTAPEGSLPAIEALEFYVPTSGHTLILSFRSWEDDFANVREVYQSIAATLTFPRPPRGPAELSDKLLRAAMVGAFVGLAILVVRMTRRRTPGPAPAG